jgi:tRNA dimethylallyltransferase
LSLIDSIHSERPVLIAGPTASGKSTLALAIAERQGGTVVNADALQSFADWRVLTARPGPGDEARAPHVLYGHVPWDRSHSVGDWLRDVRPLLERTRPIIVGGTGLYFRALTEGLAGIPPVPQQVRREAAARLDRIGLPALASELSADVRADLDLANPARVLRAWEVEQSTGRSIRDWQAETPPPLIPEQSATLLRLDAPKAWLDPRIADRFNAMIRGGALEEARAVMTRWDPRLNAAQAIGAAELVAHLHGSLTLDEAREAGIRATIRYAKRQRTWFRKRMRHWIPVDARAL